MPSIIDENKVLELLERSVPQKGTYVVMPIKDFVLNIISNASKEVVLCEDCEYYYKQPRGFSPICELIKCRAEKEGFCSWGKKKDAKEE